MAHVVPKLKLGAQVEATVTESFANGDALVNFAGDLVRVSNQTGQIFKSGDRLRLRVTAIQPLAFQMVQAPKLARRKIDVSI